MIKRESRVRKTGLNAALYIGASCGYLHFMRDRLLITRQLEFSFSTRRFAAAIKVERTVNSAISPVLDLMSFGCKCYIHEDKYPIYHFNAPG